MSIAVWIKNDANKNTEEEFDCLFCQEGNQESECPVCQGAGKLTKKRSEYFLKLANSDFCALWTRLGISFDDGDGSLCGEVSALELTSAIQSCSDQRNHYLLKLNGIAQRAFQMGEDILWG